jgi:hypothetical protein
MIKSGLHDACAVRVGLANVIFVLSRLLFSRRESMHASVGQVTAIAFQREFYLIGDGIMIVNVKFKKTYLICFPHGLFGYCLFQRIRLEVVPVV